MAIKFTKPKVAAPAKAEITKEIKSSKEVMSETHKEEPVEDAPVKPNLSGSQQPIVGFEASFTKNLGNYQSARVAVAISIPCDFSEIEQVFDYAKKWVDVKLTAEIESLGGSD